MLNLVSLIIGIVALVCAAIAFIPFLGWANWLIIPLAVIGAGHRRRVEQQHAAATSTCS